MFLQRLCMPNGTYVLKLKCSAKLHLQALQYRHIMRIMQIFAEAGYVELTFMRKHVFVCRLSANVKIIAS